MKLTSKCKTDFEKWFDKKYETHLFDHEFTRHSI